MAVTSPPHLIRQPAFELTIRFILDIFLVK